MPASSRVRDWPPSAPITNDARRLRPSASSSLTWSSPRSRPRELGAQHRDLSEPRRLDQCPLHAHVLDDRPEVRLAGFGSPRIAMRRCRRAGSCASQTTMSPNTGRHRACDRLPRARGPQDALRSARQCGDSQVDLRRRAAVAAPTARAARFAIPTDRSSAASKPADARADDTAAYDHDVEIDAPHGTHSMAPRERHAAREPRHAAGRTDAEPRDARLRRPAVRRTRADRNCAGRAPDRAVNRTRARDRP